MFSLGINCSTLYLYILSGFVEPDDWCRLAYCRLPFFQIHLKLFSTFQLLRCCVRSTPQNQTTAVHLLNTTSPGPVSLGDTEREATHDGTNSRRYCRLRRSWTRSGASPGTDPRHEAMCSVQSPRPRRGLPR